MDVSFGTIWEAVAGELPDAVAISEPDRDHTYTGFENRAARLAAAFVAALVYSDELAENVTHAAEHVPTLRILVRDGPELEALLATTPPRPAERRPGSDQLFMYTGGTTGKPKGVVWRQADLLHSLAVPIFRPIAWAKRVVLEFRDSRP